MPTLAIFITVLATGGLSIFVIRLRNERASRRDAAEEHFVGGGTWFAGSGSAGRASWPLVRLEVVPSGIVVGPTSRWLSWAVPRVMLRWSDISCVESRPTGVRFNVRSDHGPSLLFQLHRDALLAALKPYPVDLRS